MPPMLLHVSVGTTERPRFPIWLPLFLVWLIVLPVVVLVLLVAIVVDVALLLGGATYHGYTRLLLGCFGVLAATKGTVVRIRAEGRVIDIELV